jgi:hypothetical protein
LRVTAADEEQRDEREPFHQEIVGTHHRPATSRPALEYLLAP